MEKPGLWKLETAVVTKPWGLVHESALGFTSIKVGVGEFWLASAQTGPGNFSNKVMDPALRRNLADLLGEAAEAGEEHLATLIGRNAVQHLHDNPHRGKTEAWYVRAAVGRTGVAAGPRTAEDAENLKHLIMTEGLQPHVDTWSGEVRELLGVIEPLEGGEVFYVPAGTLHTMFAIGPESKLIIDEIQQGYGECLLPTLSKTLMVQDNLLSVQVHPNDDTVAATATGKMSIDQDLQANPTVRVYDFGRRPGEYPDLGFELVDPHAGLRAFPRVAVNVAEGHKFEVIVADTHLVKGRTELTAGCRCSLLPQYGGYHALHFLSGRAELATDGRAMDVTAGETVFVPACLEDQVRVEAVTDCAYFDDAFPSITRLTGFLGTRGVDAAQLETMLSPPLAREPQA